jgi:hypothetical protein
MRDVDLDRGARSGSRGQGRGNRWDLVRVGLNHWSGLTSLGSGGGLGLAFSDALNDSEIHLLGTADEFFQRLRLGMESGEFIFDVFAEAFIELEVESAIVPAGIGFKTEELGGVGGDGGGLSEGVERVCLAPDWIGVSKHRHQRRCKRGKGREYRGTRGTGWFAGGLRDFISILFECSERCLKP